MIRRVGICSVLTAAVLAISCGPVPPPKDAFTNAPDLLRELKARRSSIKSFRITGKVDHFGAQQRVQGKVFLFAELPKSLRIELVSPFNSSLSVLTVGDGRFALHDLREGRFFSGPAEPCNIARLVHIPLPAEDVISILIGDTPLIDGEEKTSWDDQGFYRVEIRGTGRVQHLEIGPSEATLPLRRSRLEDGAGTVFDIRYDRWFKVGDAVMPHEIRVKMPREKSDMQLRYDEDGVELNVALPDDAWAQTPPSGLEVEEVACDLKAPAPTE